MHGAARAKTSAKRRSKPAADPWQALPRPGRSLRQLHYRTIGQPTSNPSSGEVKNAVLLFHGTTGTGKEFLAKGFRDAMVGPGQPLDAAKYYLILPDAIGLGGSSKPSDGLHDRFPRYGYKDMVAAEERLVTEGLGINICG
jgi:homoserine O-acetyltransferase